MTFFYPKSAISTLIILSTLIENCPFHGDFQIYQHKTVRGIILLVLENLWIGYVSSEFNLFSFFYWLDWLEIEIEFIYF